MDNKYISNENLIFGLDIGTRSIVGSVGYMEHKKFNVIAHFVREHDTRAMLDGQIHDIQKVGESIGIVKHELEKQLGDVKLKDVCIAAAGRQLKTVTVHVDMDRTDDTAITSEDVYSLDSLGIEKAYDIIRFDKDTEMNKLSFYCVGYSVVKYYMNGYVISNLEGHKANSIGADVLATFLPDDVVDGLYAAVSAANLEVAGLTLEPIAAMNVAIPEQFRLLNICLVDVGAGTSDICITKDGSIVAYGMIPHAGDELTEAIVHKCLVEFKVAEDIKRSSYGDGDITYTDIMGLPNTISAEDARGLYADTLNDMTKEIADKIIELNGGKSVSAVFVVGGGGKVPDFTNLLAEHLGIQKERAALRGKEVLGDINFTMEGVEKDPLLVTPIGICINYYNQKNNFIFVNMNDIRIKLYDNGHLTVVDAAVQTGFPNEDLFAKRGKELNFTLNKTTKMIRGQLGEAAVITINNHEGNFHSSISANDKIYVKESTAGADAFATIDSLPEYKELLTFVINNAEIICPKFVSVNGNLVTGSYQIQENDDITILDYYTVKQLYQFMDIDPMDKQMLINHHVPEDDEPVYENFKITFADRDWESYEQLLPEDVDDIDSAIDDTEEVMDTNSDIAEEKSSTEPEKMKELVPVTIHISVNQSPVILSGKEEYVFVDVFDQYPFDTKKVGGIDLVTKINGNRCAFLDPVQDGDVLEVYWNNE